MLDFTAFYDFCEKSNLSLFAKFLILDFCPGIFASALVERTTFLFYESEREYFLRVQIHEAKFTFRHQVAEQIFRISPSTDQFLLR